MGKCSSKRAVKEDFIEQRRNGLLKSKQCSPIFVTITNNYGNVNITSGTEEESCVDINQTECSRTCAYQTECSQGNTYSDGKDVKSKGKANSLEIEENKQQRDNDFEHSIYSNTKTSFVQEPSYTSNNNITNTKFERLRDEYCENDSTLSGIGMLNLKASTHVGEDCYPVEDTYNPSKSFQSDIQKNVHFAREDITQRVVNGKTHRHVDSDYERSPESRSTRKYHSEGSGVNFSSILSEHRSFCPADGEETSPEQVNELCNTNMIQLNQLVPDCCDNVNESQSSLPPQDSFRYSFSRSVTGYPDGTDSYVEQSRKDLFESDCFDSVSTFDGEYSKSSLQLSTHSWNDDSASAMTANDQCGQFLNNTCLSSDSKDKACKDTVNNLGFQTTSSVDDKVCPDYAQNNLVVRSSYRFSDSFSQDSSCEQTVENQSNNCDQDGFMEKYAECSVEHASKLGEYTKHFCAEISSNEDVTEVAVDYSECILKTIAMDVHVVIILRDVTVSMYFNFKSIKQLSFATLNHIQTCCIHGVENLYFPVHAKNTRDKANLDTCVKAMSPSKNESAEKGNAVLRNMSSSSPGIRCNDHASENSDVKEEENGEINQGNKLISCKLLDVHVEGKCGHTYILDENEDLATNLSMVKSREKLTSIHETEEANCQNMIFFTVTKTNTENVVSQKGKDGNEIVDAGIKEQQTDQQHSENATDTHNLHTRLEHVVGGNDIKFSKRSKDNWRKKKIQKSRRREEMRHVTKSFTSPESSEDSSLDSSWKEKDFFNGNRCRYCNQSLNIPNTKCKHHKCFRHPKPEGKYFDTHRRTSAIKDDDTAKLFQESVKIDSGISSGSDTSILFLQKTTDIKHNFSKMKKTSRKTVALHKVSLKKNNSGKFLCQGKLRFTEFRNVTRNVCARERQRQIAKAIARELHVDERNFTVFGLGSYFDRLNNGPLPSAQEQMQYEWLRLATFSTYTGNGNALALARNGFFHDNNEGPTYTRCYLCNAHHSCWEMFDDVAEQHRQQSPNCPFVTNRDQSGLNISITPEYHDNASRPTRTSTASTTSIPTVTAVTHASSNAEAAINEVERNLRRTIIGQHQLFHNDEESIPQQPTDDPESRDRSLLALSQASTQRALGRSGHSFSTIIAPRRNNVAMGARSNVGIETSSSGSTSTGTPSQPSGIRLSSAFGGPVGAGAFSGLNSATQRPQVPVSTATESSQGSSVTTSTTTHTSQATGEAAVGPGAEGITDPTTTVVYHPKHPDYLNVNKRIDSYTGWPAYLDQTPRQMAEAGFFYVGVADFTRCFCCGGGLRNWEPGDDPMLEHTRWFPRCEYVVRLKGERYVSAVQRRHQEHMAEQQRQQVELARSRDETSNPPDPLDTEAAAVMREMGYSEGRTREAVLAVRQQTGSSLVTTPQVLTWLLDDEDRQSALGVRPPPSSASSTPSSVVNTSIPSSVVYTGTSIASSVVYTGISIPSSVVYSGTSIASSFVNTGTNIRTSIVNSTRNVSTATSIVNTATSTSTVSRTSTITTAEVQQTGSPTSSGVRNTSVTRNQQAEGRQTENNSSSVSGSSSRGESVEKQSGGSGGSGESKSSAQGDTVNKESKATKKKSGKKKTKNKAESKPGMDGAKAGDIDPKYLKAENEKLREMQTCKICMEQPVNTTLLPCGHLVCCENCAARLARCPICRKRIEGTVKTFMS